MRYNYRNIINDFLKGGKGKKALCFLFLFSFLSVNENFAQDGGIEKAPIVTRLTGTVAVTGTNPSLPLQQGVFTEVAYTSEGEQSNKIKNIITLSVIEESAKFIPVGFTATVQTRIDYGHTSAYGNHIVQDLIVDYNKNAGAKYNARNYFSFDGAEFVKITVQQVTITPTGTVNFDLEDVLLLENELRVTQYFELGSNIIPVSFNGPASIVNPADEISASWSWAPGSGNNYTQLEWTWLETEMEAAYYIPNTTTVDENLLFANNSTRIDLPVSINAYKIPLFYDGSGKLYYRIRPVNIKDDGSRRDGNWTAAKTCSYEGHDNNLNWQATTTFAEDGKRKSVIEYFDGSLRGRQTVTKDNVTQTTITAETFYDGQGRPAIQILPTPGISSIIQYQKNLNMFNGQANIDDPAKFFDLVATGIVDHSTPPLNNSSGTSKYYSASNPEIGQQQNKYIPDAEGYPYTVTRYTPDATGRVMSQSGVGVSHKMGSGKETKYFYGGAKQEELDGLFGTEVGNFTHYFKNMVRDANGQMSVSYTDMHGRTIATALAGESPANLDALNISNNQVYPNQNGNAISVNLLDANSNIIKENSLESINNLLVPATTTYNFQYNLAPGKLEITSCSPGVQLCYDCLYDLQISITDESGDTDPQVWKFTNVSVNPDDDCNTSTPAISLVSGTGVTINGSMISFSYQLQPGSYSIRKTLTISESSIQKYLDLYFPNSVCKTRQELIDSVFNVLQAQTNCDNPNGGTTEAACTECMDNLGADEETFRANYLTSLGYTPAQILTTLSPALEAEIKTAYKTAKDNCQLLCNTTSTNELATIRQQMLEDMKPYSGQYAVEETPAVSVDRPSIAMFRKYDIFSTQFSGQPFYKSPKDPQTGLPGFYKDASGVKDQTIHYIIPPSTSEYDVLNATTKEQFQQLFKDSWADALLPYHPEYNKLIYAEDNLVESYNWIDKFSAATTYTQASDPLNNYILTNGTSTAAPYNDPFYMLAPAGTYLTPMLNKVKEQQFVKLQDAPNEKWASMWQMARAAVVCTNITNENARLECIIGTPFTVVPKLPPYNDVTTTADKNKMWEAFQGFYMNERRKDINKYIKDNTPAVENDLLIAEKYTLHFHETDQQIANQGNQTGSGQNSPWTWWPSTANYPPTGINLDPTINNTNTFTSRCDGYIQKWKAELLQCPQIEALAPAVKDALLTEITNGMKQVCINGSDAANPYGSSNVKPGSSGPQSFEEVINTAFANPAYGISITNLCNPYMIEWPKPYGKGPKMFQDITSVIDSCACAQFTLIKNEAAAAEYDPNVLSSLNQYLQLNYQDTLSQGMYDALQNCSSYTRLVCDKKDSVITANCYDPEPCTYIKSEQLCLNGISLYQKIYGGIKDEFAYSSAPAADSSYVVVGKTNSFGHGGFDALVMKINKHGAVVWSKALGGTNDDEFNQVEKTSDNGFIACGSTRSYGNTYGNAWLVKLDASGNIQWSKKYGDGSVQGTLGTDVTQLSDGGYSFCGLYNWTGGSGGIGQSLVVRTDGQGNVIWSKQYGVSSITSDDAYSILEDGDSLVVTGVYNGSFSFMDGYIMKLDKSNGSIQWTKKYDAENRSTWFGKITKTNTGYQVFSSLTDNFGSQNQQLGTWNLNANGTFQNVRKTVIPGTTTISAGLHTLADGGFIIAQGENNNNSDVLLSRVNAGGTIGWSKKYIRNGRQQMYAIQPSGEGGYLIIGNNNNAGITTDSSNVYIMKTDSVGDAGTCSGINTNDVTVVTPSFVTADITSLVTQNDVTIINPVITVNAIDFVPVTSTVCFHCEPVAPLVLTCDQYKQAIASFYDTYGAVPGASCNNDFIIYFNNFFSLTPAWTYQQIADGYLAACGQALQVCVACYTQVVCKTDTNCRMQFVPYNLPAPEPMPAFLKCGFQFNKSCVSCAQLSTLTGQFKTTFSGQYNAAPVFSSNNPTDEEIASNVLYAKFLNYKTGFQYGWTTYAQAAANASPACDLANYAGNTGATQNVICGDAVAVTDGTGLIVQEDPCQHVQDQAEAIGNAIWLERSRTLMKNFEAAYRAKCFAVENTESFTVSYTNKEYHYTLYYYDMAGNLVKTVPPKGVHPDFSAPFLTAVKNARAACTAEAGCDPPVGTLPPHTLITEYRYNSLNQVVVQQSPDGGKSKFWYDVLGRLVVSQNAQQYINNKYSYTLYDALGRITEVGQKPQTAPMTQLISQNKIAATALNDWIVVNGGTREQITYTFYDLPYGYDDPGGPLLIPLLTQQNLRNRVSFTATKNLITDVFQNTATFYTYDIHGNVDTLLQDYKGIAEMDQTSNRFKMMTYKYDLISGKVNRVSYQPDKPDAFYHRYNYDADNQVTSVETSRDKIYWERDAAYRYYKYGPLARAEYGQLRVQGMDYAYTIQGWLKGVNSTAITTAGGTCPGGSVLADILNVNDRAQYQQPTVYSAQQEINFNPDFESITGDEFETLINPGGTVCVPGQGGAAPYVAGDIGRDGDPTYTTPVIPPVARDAIGFSLNYFNNDYKPIDVNVMPFANGMHNLPQLNGDGVNTGAELFNGNIASMMVNIPKLGLSGEGNSGIAQIVYGYRYDQLNRITGMNAYTGFNNTNNTFTPTAIQDFKERVSYDPNGNILSYNRNGSSAAGNQAMDQLHYRYYYIDNNDVKQEYDPVAGLPLSGVKSITNQLASVKDDLTTAGGNDIETQPDKNYEYDAIGNLISDDAEGISNIEWTVYGKIKTITKTDGTVINYVYDASGNRIQKTVIPPSGGGGAVKHTMYVRDASGNVMAIYEKSGTGATEQTETHLYGSSRIGMQTKLTIAPVETALSGGFTAAYLSTFTRSEKLFELNNHLGNVLVTISDRKLQVDADGNGVIDYYNADVITATDYYPFGMDMPGRKFGNESRYGFNGKERDKDLHSLDAYDYGFRIYNPAIARFLSVDPLTKNYPSWSPYPFAMDRPIDGIDLDGSEWQWFLIPLFDRVLKRYIGIKPVNEKQLASERYYQTANTSYKAIKFMLDMKIPMLNFGGKKFRSDEYYALEDYVTSGMNSGVKSINVNSETGLFINKWLHDFSYLATGTYSQLSLLNTIGDIFALQGASNKDKLDAIQGLIDQSRNEWRGISQAGIAFGSILLSYGGTTPSIKNLRVSLISTSAQVSKGVNIAAGSVKFDQAATVAAERLGFLTEHVAIKNGVAEVPIIYTSSVSLSDLSAVSNALRANGATSMIVNSGPIINPSISSRLLNAFKQGKEFMGFKVTETGNPNNMFILSKKL